jgi:hypothetical protein
MLNNGVPKADDDAEGVEARLQAGIEVHVEST